MRNAFGRFSVAIVTPFVTSAGVGHQHPIDQRALELLIRSVSDGLSEVKTKVRTRGLDESLIGGLCHLSEVGLSFCGGVSATTVADALTLASKAVEIGCDGIMLGLPPYLRLCQEEIINYVESVRAVVPRSIPLLLYNNAMRNSYGATAETLVYLHQNEVIWGVKHASTNFSADCEKIFSLDSSIRLYTGGDLLTKDLMINPTSTSKFYGLTSILGNVFPAALGEMVADFVAYSPGQMKGVVSNISMEARELALKELGDAVLVGCTLPVGVKYALQLRGIPVGEARPPIGHLSEAKRIEIESSLHKFASFLLESAEAKNEE